MACRWRIRHKLILGLGLVVGILALLLAGTYKGLASYRATTNCIDSKLVELRKAQELKEALKAPDTTDPNEAWNSFGPAREKLNEYEEALKDTIDRHRDADNGYNELGLVDALRGIFKELHRAIEKLKQARVSPEGTNPAVVEDAVVKPVYLKLIHATDDLHGAIYHSLFKRINAAKGDYKTSLIIVLATSVLGILLMSSLLRFFYRWTFHPIRDLQQGVDRVAHGDFEHTHRGPQRRRDGGPGRGLQRHDRPAARHVPRPGPAGQRAQPAAGPLRAAGRRRLPGGRRRPRDQQSAGQHRLLQRGPGSAGWPSSWAQSPTRCRLGAGLGSSARTPDRARNARSLPSI